MLHEYFWMFIVITLLVLVYVVLDHFLRRSLVRARRLGRFPLKKNTYNAENVRPGDIIHSNENSYTVVTEVRKDLGLFYAMVYPYDPHLGQGRPTARFWVREFPWVFDDSARIPVAPSILIAILQWIHDVGCEQLRRETAFRQWGRS